MLLPQSSAFAALKNRLNSVNAIALLHTTPSMPSSARPSYVYPSYLPHSLSPTSPTLGPGTSSPSSHHNRQRSTEKPIPLSLSTHTIGIGTLTPFANSVAAGSNIPGSSTSTVARLARRDQGGGSNSGEVRWNELLDKFKSTQERARRRNERAMRGEEDDADNEFARKQSVSKTRDGTADQGGRDSRASGRLSLETGRPGSGLSLDRGNPGSTYRQSGSTGTHASQGLNRGLGLRQERPADGQSGGEQRPGHKSKHSLIGKFGLRTGSKDKDKDTKFGGAGTGGSTRR